ncbi:MAG: radical SAM protein [Longimicrobiales bacterium]|nr:radical SAM protein [Longimicrobiales bacterium]
MAGPGRLVSVTKRGFRNILSNKPLCVSFEITHACNAQCQHCHRGGPVDENRASPGDFARIYRELSPPVVQVSGGEPLLRDDVLEVIRALRQPDGTPYTILVTNGSLLTPEGFRQTHEAGIDAYSISLDYPDDRHDEFRMIPGLFDHIKDLIGSLAPAERRMITLNCVTQSDNFRDALGLASLALEWGVSVNFSPYTWLRTQDRGYAVAKEDLPELREIFRRLLEFQRRHDTVKANTTFLNNIVAFFDDKGIPGCRAGERFMVVNPDGTLSPCGLIITDYPDRAAMREGFVKSNSCTACNTSIRAWTERPFSMFFSNIRPSMSSN